MQFLREDDCDRSISGNVGVYKELGNIRVGLAINQVMCKEKTTVVVVERA